MGAVRAARWGVPLLAVFLASATASEGGDEWCDGYVLDAALVCDYGCFDTEDQACHDGLTRGQCAEIYGHVTWGRRCNCRPRTGLTADDGAEGPRGAEDDGSRLFSVPAFVVLFRESLEVVVVLVIVIRFLQSGRADGTISAELFKRLIREVYLGASLGFCVCLLVLVGFLALASLLHQVFKCDKLLIFDGVLMTLACVVLTFLALSFYKLIYTKEAHELEMRRRIEATIALSREGGSANSPFGKRHAFFVLAFTAVLRAGMESILFLVGAISDFKDPSYVSSLPLPVILAVILSSLVAWLFSQSTKVVRVDVFMRFCSVVLLFIAAGFCMQSVHKWQELGVFGAWKVPAPERPWQNRAVWDISGCCSDKTNRFFVLMKTLLGYQDRPTPVELCAYAVYWPTALVISALVVRRAVRRVKEKMQVMQRDPQAGQAGVLVQPYGG